MATLEKTLAVKLRGSTGTTSSHALRAAGRVPAILFGHGAESTALELDAKAFDELLHDAGPNAMLTIAIEHGDRDTVLVRDVQRDPITRRVIHADLQRVRANEEITATLPVVTVGVSDGVKNHEGVLDIVLHEIEVRGPANALPEQIEIDVESLGLHDKVHANEIKLPKKLSLVTSGELVVISVEPSKVAQLAAEAEAILAEAQVLDEPLAEVEGDADAMAKTEEIE